MAVPATLMGSILGEGLLPSCYTYARYQGGLKASKSLSLYRVFFFFGSVAIRFVSWSISNVGITVTCVAS